MCGINGVIRPASQENAKSYVKAMNGAMAHRGPDAEGIWSNDSIVLGHRRLSIIDTSAAGNQPFVSQDGNLVIAFNGEIYNYLELRNELQGFHSFSTETDTEVLLAAYEKWGIQMTEHLFGMFAFVIHDLRSDETHVVRDRMGVKPLYYFPSNHGLFFASEVRSLLSTGCVPRKIDPQGLREYLKYQTVHAPRTILEGVKMLEAGHRLHFKGNLMQSICYWNAKNPPLQQVDNLSRKEILAGVYQRLQRSVEMRMRADVPFGAFLSGGIDSSAIVGLMATSSKQPIKTFSVTFNEKQWDESTYSNLIAKRYQTDHCEIRLSATHFMQQVPQAVAAMDHPSGDGPNTYVVSQVTREAGVKMALSGIGGDELFAGYDVFLRLDRLQKQRHISRIPRGMRAFIGKCYQLYKSSAASEKIASTLATPHMEWHEVYPLVRAIHSDRQIDKYLAHPIQDPLWVNQLCVDIESTNLPFLSKISLAESNSYLQNVLLRDSDQMSMAHALEVREPFLDHDLIEWVLAVSDVEKYPHFPKQLLVEAMGDLLPPEIVHRPKMGFTFPWDQWMKHELKSYCIEGLQALQRHPLINGLEIEKSWQDFLQGSTRITWSRIWPLVVLGQWMKINQIEGT